MIGKGSLWSLPANLSKRRAPSGPRKQPERSLQIRVATMLSWMLPPEVPWTSIAHGVFIPGKLGERIGGQLKASGLHRGWPDLHFIWRGIPAYIELKAGSSLSPEQRDVHARIKLAGGRVAVCKSEDEVVAFLADLGIEMRVRLSPAERAMADRQQRLANLGKGGD
jgi:hypothetical protein